MRATLVIGRTPGSIVPGVINRQKPVSIQALDAQVPVEGLDRRALRKRIREAMMSDRRY
jgi:hypothetical protein